MVNRAGALLVNNTITKKFIDLEKYVACHNCQGLIKKTQLRKCSRNICKLPICKQCSTEILNKAFCPNCVAFIIKHKTYLLVPKGDIET